ncbi:MAG: DoxX family membrane protein [Pseudonocardia sp.]|nr:DoxX family membrane protein [Pseudonocardia sp.]
MVVQSSTPATRAPSDPETTFRARGGPELLAVLRILTGLTFLWAFLDKTFGLGYATPAARAWIAGGSPTKGFLGGVDVGPLQEVFRSMAGNPFADWLFMIGLLGIGAALVLGIGMRVAAVAGAVLLMAMWLASWPMAALNAAGEPTSSTNPFIDDHLVNAVLVIALAVYAAGDTWGLGRTWGRLPLVRRNPWLR